MSRPHGSGLALPLEIVPTLRALYKQGHTYLAIAKILGASYSAVYRAVNKIGGYSGVKP